MYPVVIGGSPGCGKTTLSSNLSNLDENGVHIQTDYFFHFVSHHTDPSKPEAQAQNCAVIEAYCAAASAFLKNGYAVYIDGVIGPWHHAQLSDLLGPFHYFMLHAPLSVTLERVARRDGQSSAHPSVVKRMHPKFESVLDQVSESVVLTHNLSLDELETQVIRKIQSTSCVVSSD